MKTYRCDNCGGTFISDVSDEEEFAECQQNFGSIPPPHDQATVCDKCYREFMEWYDRKTTEELEQLRGG